MGRYNWISLLCLFVCLSVPLDVFSGTENLTSLVPDKAPDGWVAQGTPKIFTKKTLFEHIDGQADLFLQYGFEGSVFTVYQNKNASQERIDSDIYDMGDAVQAFGIFSRFRQDDHPAGIGLDSYLEDGYALFYKGKYFVVLQASEANPSSLKQLARMIESRIPDSSPPPKEITYFPKHGLKPGSIEYYPQGLMGRQFLKKGFKATYLISERSDAKTETEAEGPDSTLFLAIFDSSREAENALKKFKDDLSKRGSAVEAMKTDQGSEMVTGADPYQGKLIIVHKGRHLAGAAGFARENDAQSLLADLVKRLSGQEDSAGQP